MVEWLMFINFQSSISLLKPFSRQKCLGGGWGNNCVIRTWKYPLDYFHEELLHLLHSEQCFGFGQFP